MHEFLFQLYQEGIINGLTKKWFHTDSLCSTNELSGTRLETMLFLLVMLVSGIVFSLLTLLAENLLFYRFSKGKICQVGDQESLEHTRVINILK